jgi:cystathionine gamma-synthase
LLFGSGMAAIAAVFCTLEPEAHVVLPDSMYWGVFSWNRQHCVRTGITIRYYAPDDGASLAAAVQGHARTDLLWLETPSNPMMHVTDIRMAAGIAHAAGALLVVDNTVPTPLFTQPLELGGDIVMHSATKFLNGHSDVIAGALITRERQAHWQRIVTERHDAGAVICPFDAWLLVRGMQTLFVRLARYTTLVPRIRGDNSSRRSGGCLGVNNATL